jgi:hypothetical protein
VRADGPLYLVPLVATSQFLIRDLARSDPRRDRFHGCARSHVDYPEES